MKQIDTHVYLQRLVSWAQDIQQYHQFYIRSHQSRDQDQLSARLDFLIQDINETINRSYSLQSNELLNFQHQANDIYHEVLWRYQSSEINTFNKANKVQKHDDEKPFHPSMIPPNWVPFYNHSPQTIATFKALVDTMIPSPWTDQFKMDEYLMMILDHFISTQEEWVPETLHLSTPTAEILDIAATKLTFLKSTKNPTFDTVSQEGAFTTLSHNDRIKAVSLLENLQIDLNALPSPFFNNGELNQFVVTYAFQMVKFGFYSEWISYGSTRFASPEDRVRETIPYTWDLVGYPGVSYGYRALRGFLIDEFDEKVE
ncbi:hypothetical protein [Alkalibacillus silvisoli]|uniref:DUF3231 family protein n=1 Tax=Alkalibacillus silvisoli TaxID=392823 RepID=A0ABN0ZN50_9BACI